MSFKSWALSTVLINGIKAADKKALVKEWADQTDRALDKEFPKRSETVQVIIVRHLLFPFCKELMREAPTTYIQLLKAESQEVIDELVK